jgi:hypothetical protein
MESDPIYVGLVGGSFGRFSDFIFGGCWADEARPTYGLTPFLCHESDPIYLVLRFVIQHGRLGNHL